MSVGFDATERVNKWLLDAFQRGASDLHIEHVGRSLRVRARVDGALERLDLLIDVNVSAVFARLKVMAELDLNEKRLPQDGRFHAHDFIKENKVKALDVRINVMAGIAGEKAVLRLIDHKKMRFKLEELGFSKQALARYKACLQKPHGLILHVGPTGSGKSTSLYVATESVHGPGLNMVTVEDPVEFTREGVLQTQVQPDIGLTFPVILRALLRQDPDIIMVGEIRDAETAEIALQAACTGHLVFSSMHTNDALGTLGRVRDMGMPAYKLADALQCVVGQRFVRKLCTCKQLLRLPGIEKDPARKLYRKHGCAFCKQTGFAGRSLVMEVLTVDDRLRAAIANEVRSKGLRKIARAAGWRSLFQEGWLKALAGITSPAEVLRVTEGIEIGDGSGAEIAKTVQRLLRSARGKETAAVPKAVRKEVARKPAAPPAPASSTRRPPAQDPKAGRSAAGVPRIAAHKPRPAPAKQRRPPGVKPGPRAPGKPVLRPGRPRPSGNTGRPPAKG